ncbi:hypothetical protein M514_20995 [Trichuris suis]|uniref:Uncharacterized protein n=1 Tax=Trichuris suis TaxID=68888 RepID=A0A085NBK5_9BILA|nr:hypothetical protein M514_20995 [Trichuris suis]
MTPDTEAGPSRAAYRAMQFTSTEPPHHVRDLRRRTSPEESPSERLQTEDSYDDVAGPSAARMAPSDEDPEAGQGALRRSSRLRKARSLNSCDS